MKIRALSIALIRNEDKIFVMECYDQTKNEIFYRPLGGGIEFHELGEATLKREFQEEMGAELKNIKYLTAFENLFTFDGAPGHEMILLFSAEFVDKTINLESEVLCNEEGTPFTSKWIHVQEFVENRSILYPEGLREYL